MATIAEALARVRERIAHAEVRANRSAGGVTLVAVSKTFPASDVTAAIAAGQLEFGENRVEEALPKQDAVARADVAWHLIGHVQSRKARDAAGRFALIHSVDSFKLAQKLSTALQPGKTQAILLQCNVSGEASKEGFDLAGWEREAGKLDAFETDIRSMIGLAGIEIQGLMTIAPIVASAEAARPVFGSLAALREAMIGRIPGINWRHLSMGMSDDMDAAIAEGATLVRVGRAIFGAR